VSVFTNLHRADHVCLLYGLRVCYKTFKLNKFTKKYICFCNWFKVRGAWDKGNYLWGRGGEKVKNHWPSGCKVDTYLRKWQYEWNCCRNKCYLVVRLPKKHILDWNIASIPFGFLIFLFVSQLLWGVCPLYRNTFFEFSVDFLQSTLEWQQLC